MFPAAAGSFYSSCAFDNRRVNLDTRRTARYVPSKLYNQQTSAVTCLYRLKQKEKYGKQQIVNPIAKPRRMV
jgi:hypothetical protein